MSVLLRLSDRFTRWLSFIGMIGVLAMMVHIGVDVVSRTLFSVSVPVTLEMVTRYYMLMLVMLPLAWVEMNRDMIVVEVFSGVYGKKGIRFVDAAVAVMCACIYGLMAYGTWQKAMSQYDIGAYIVALDVRIIVWPGYFALPFGFALAGLVCLIRLPALFSENPESQPAQ